MLMLGILRWSWKITKPSGLGANKKISRRLNVSGRIVNFRWDFVSLSRSMNWTHASGCTSRRGARYG